MRPYFGLRSYTDNVKCYDCMLMEDNGRDPRQAWPDYGTHVREVHIQHYDGQIGSEATPAEYVAALIECTREWVRVLKGPGSLFVNLGDKYDSGTTAERVNPGTVKDGQSQGWYQATPRVSLGKPKSLLGLPWRYALACMDQLGLILRAEIIWNKPNGLPESVTDRVRRAHEQVFHFTRLPRYYSAVDEIREPHAEWTLKAYAYEQAARARNGTGYNRRKNANRVDEGDAGDYAVANPLGKLPGSVWSIPSQPLTVPPHLGTDHFAAFPMELPRRIIAGWSPPGVCTACGEGRRPVVVVDKPAAQTARIARLTASQVSRAAMDGGTSSVTLGVDASALNRRITGYACACPPPDAPTRPAVILDPFGGTGTTALLASALGRHGITIDRSADYCRLAAWRTTDPGERARALQVPKPPPVPQGQDTLFDI